MPFLIIFGTLVLGYYYANSYLPAKLALKQKDGWVAYSHLGYDGIRFLAFGFLIAVVTYAIFFVLALILTEIFLCIDVFHFRWERQRITGWVDEDVFFIEGLHYGHLCIMLFALGACQQEIDEKNNDENYIQSLYDADKIFGIASQSLDKGQLVRLSLKSRKVYIGIIIGDVVADDDDDYLLLMPVYSGYRSKDELKMQLDCDYSRFYRDKNISFTSNEKGVSLEDFRIAIQSSEIESVSMFSFDYYKEFKSNEHLPIGSKPDLKPI